MISFDNLIALHEMLWPDTNLEQQNKKWCEEYSEYLDTPFGNKEEALFEIADMVIVSAGIARFDYPKGLLNLNWAFNTCSINDFGTNELWRAVEIKMRKNMKRDWQKKDDVGYKHTKGIED